MKTTIDIADDLIKRARQIQKRTDITLRALVEEGLRYAIGKHSTTAKKYKFNLPVAGEPYKPGMPVIDVTAIIRQTYKEREERSIVSGRMAEPSLRYSSSGKLRKGKPK